MTQCTPTCRRMALVVFADGDPPYTYEDPNRDPSKVRVYSAIPATQASYDQRAEVLQVCHVQRSHGSGNLEVHITAVGTDVSPGKSGTSGRTVDFYLWEVEF
jgi:hypothetical protein